MGCSLCSQEFNWRQRAPTWDGWYYWSMDVLPAASGSWFELDGSKSARVQPAGALGVHGSPSGGGTLVK